MLILGIDTSGRQGSVALLQQQGEALLTLSLTELSGGQYSERLVPTIAELLQHHNFERRAIGLIGVASGPGSFTGLRIAIATVKGIAEAFAIPVVAVSMLEAVALASGAEGEVIAALDAQRSEVFFGDYTIAVANSAPAASDPVLTHREGLASFADFTSMVAARPPNAKVFTPDSDLAARLREAAFDVEVISRPSADAFGRLAHRKFLAGDCEDVAILDANYLRRSDAEIFVAPNKAGTAPH
jgi:tRNA threonylcarbamoyladenosine biosynthesis protein TsaB